MLAVWWSQIHGYISTYTLGIPLSWKTTNLLVFFYINVWTPVTFTFTTRKLSKLTNQRHLYWVCANIFLKFIKFQSHLKKIWLCDTDFLYWLFWNFNLWYILYCIVFLLYSDIVHLWVFMMLCYILCCTQPYNDLLVTSYICNICNLLDQHTYLRSFSKMWHLTLHRLQYKHI